MSASWQDMNDAFASEGSRPAGVHRSQKYDQGNMNRSIILTVALSASICPLWFAEYKRYSRNNLRCLAHFRRAAIRALEILLCFKIRNNLSREKKNETAVTGRLVPSYHQVSCDKCAREGQRARNQNVALLKSCKPVIKCSSLFGVQLTGGNPLSN